MSATKHSFFDFINKFTTAEQSQFVKYANLESRKGDTKHVKLFKAVAKMDTYNEWKAMKAAGYTSRNTFAKGRLHLMEQLHRFLRHLEAKKAKADKNILLLVHEAITDIIILQERAPDFVLPKLKDTIQLAKQYQLNTELLSLLQLQKVYLRRGYIKNASLLIQDTDKKITQTLQILDLESKIIQHYDLLFIQKNQLDKAAWQEKLETCIQFFKKNDIHKKALSLKAWIAYYFIWAKYYEFIEPKPEKVADQWKAMLNLLEQNSALKNEHQERYLNIYYNYYGSLIQTQKLDAKTFDMAMQAMQQLSPKTAKIATLIEQNQYYYRLQYAYIQDDYTTIINVAKLVQAMEIHYLSLEKSLIFKYHLAAAYFNQAATTTPNNSTTGFQQALESAYEIESHKTNNKTEVYLKTKLLLACIAYAQEDDLTFETHYNALRYLLRDTSVQVEFSIGKQILFTLHNALKAPLDEQKFHFQKCLQQLPPNANEQYREFVYWMKTCC